MVNMQTNRSPLETEPLTKLLFRYSVPTTLTLMVNYIYNIVDQIFVGQGVGITGMAAINIAFPLSILVNAVSLLLGDGCAANVSLCLGRREQENANKIFGQAVTWIVASGIALAFICGIFAPHIVTLFGTTNTAYGESLAYMRVIAIGIPFQLICPAFTAMIRADGSPQYTMKCMMVGAVVNIILDPVFIFAFSMGVRGAALATVISQALSALWALQFLRGKRTILHLKRKNLWIKPRILFPCIGLGIAPFIMMSTESLLTLCFNTSLLKYGGDLAVGAMTILSSIMQFALLPMQGLTQGGQPIISYNYGARNMERIRQAVRLQTICCVTYSGIMWALAELIPSMFVTVFTSDSDLMEITCWALRIYMAAVILMGLQTSCQQCFISFGNAKTSAFLAILRKVLLLIPLIFVLPNFFSNKVFAVFLAEPVADVIAVATTVTLFVREMKKLGKELE